MGLDAACMRLRVQISTSMPSRTSAARFLPPPSQEAPHTGQSLKGCWLSPRAGSRASHALLPAPRRTSSTSASSDWLNSCVSAARSAVGDNCLRGSEEEALAPSGQADLAGIELPDGWCFRIGREPGRECASQRPVSGRFDAPVLPCLLPSPRCAAAGWTFFLGSAVQMKLPSRS